MRQTPVSWSLIFATLLVACVYQIAVVAFLALPADFAVANSLLFFGCTTLAFVGSPYPSGPYQSIMTFYAIFFGVIPALHFSQGVVLWNVDPHVLDWYVPATWLAIAGLAAFHIAYRANARGAIKASPKPVGRSIDGTGAGRLLLLSSTATIAIYALNGFSIQSVFVRGGDLKTIGALGQMGHLIFQFFVVPIPCIAFLHHILRSRRLDRPAIVLAILFLLASPPTGMARFQAATLYIAAALAALPTMMNSRALLPLALLSGMLMIFPFLEAFRNFSPANPLPSLSLDFIYAGHFDSFQSFAAALLFGEINWGYGLLGVLLFFVPRSLWESKPIGSGAALAEQEGFSFSNISMNYLGEGYLNFGIAGIIGFAVAAGWLLGRLDTRYWLGVPSQTGQARYLLLIGLVFFIARGDLLSSFAFTVGILTSNWAVGVLATQKVRQASVAMPAPKGRSKRGVTTSMPDGHEDGHRHADPGGVR